MAKTNNKPETAETATPSFEDIKAELDAVQAELAAARNDVEMLTTALAKAEDDKKAAYATRRRLFGGQPRCDARQYRRRRQRILARRPAV